MKQLYVLAGRITWAVLLLVGLLAAPAQAQQRLNYSSRGYSAFPGTYTDLGTAGTVITTANFDNANSAPQEIGFTFAFNGQSFTQFVLNTNGFLRLGNQPSKKSESDVEGAFFNSPMVSDDPADVNLLAPFSQNLDGSSTQTPEYRVATTGTAPNRVCTIQWKNVADIGKTTPRQFAAMSFQVKLYETSNAIEFVYDKVTPTTNTVASKASAVGIKGSGINPNQQVILIKAPSVAWSGARASDVTYYDSYTFGVRRTVLPTPGLTYRFEATPQQDALVSNIYTLGQLPIEGDTPHKVQARVQNVGVQALSNVKVTLQVSGATDFTSTRTISLAPDESAVVTFDGYTPLLVGSNTVEVHVNSDGKNTNNSLTVTQKVTTNLLGYADESAILPAVRRPGERLSLVRHALQQTKAVRSLQVQISDNVYSVGQTVYAVVLDAAGTVIGRSGNYRLTNDDLSQTLTFTLNSPIKLEAGKDYYLGLAETLLTGNDGYEAIALQSETPTRPDSAYFRAPLEGGQPHSFLEGRFMIVLNLTTVPDCLAPQQLTADNVTAEGATLTFTPVAGAASYAVEYGPKGFVPGTGKGTVVNGITSSPYVLKGVPAGALYDVYVRTVCSGTSSSGVVGPATFQTLCGPAAAATIPYRLDFDTVKPGTLPCGVTIFDTAKDSYTWSLVVDPGADYHNAMRSEYDFVNPADDWFFTAPLHLVAGEKYKVGFDYRANSSALPVALAVTWGTAADTASQKKVLWSNLEIANDTYLAAQDVLLLEPTTTGDYYVGFHAISQPARDFLYVKNVQVTNNSATAASAALNRALSIYPVPAAGQLLLEARGAAGKGPLQVEILNMLGQRVYAGTARDNFINRLDVDKLANGRYILKVQSDSGYAVRAIQVQH